MRERSLEGLREVAGPVSRETFERLQQFEATFLKWASRINLAAPSTLSDIWSRHILDSAQLAMLAPEAGTWLDVGSGGGFPGAVMAILLQDRPGATIDLVESNRKKAAFLQSALAAYRRSVRIHPKRIEEVYGIIERPDVVTARALAPLPLLLDLCSPWLTTGSRGLFHKGRDYRVELKESDDAWTHDLVEHKSRIDDDSVILEIRNLRPRQPA
ncbi:ribosomal RNA small subunit methyltransferase G [Mesorhizobium sp. L-8-10]|uniref:16S rRNA (guanine(527)-N(7))-methyltransferase RsmG n=1 Tax=unclassified Mesorhizobium TaxID=325217 RepID=UPI0019272FE0|nr:MULTISPECIES: 16S rRNA (guanine(527)-N(7))-methyltransferase RsmG [unclassified Mesorhizobium]BCH21411.1 ribosomal RNA small subunit methyltransferase G [Mesorhizobium sp. L-8-3]BCH29245.1 ribosomal RNA small subunit methyltransferase G [Mesorhizobium sp. L-8-10]